MLILQIGLLSLFYNPSKLNTIPSRRTQVLLRFRKSFSGELKYFFATSKSGWMTRDLFLLWINYLINWMTEHKKALASNLRNTRSLLILNGQRSRECPLALQALYNKLREIHVFPAHTTHITQII